MKPRHFLLIVAVLLFASPAATLQAADAFRDKGGNEIYVPKDKTIISLKSPGIWKSVADLHNPAIYTKVRKEGLENIRVLKIQLPYPVLKDDPDAIKALYVLDKDGLIVGYHLFSAGEQSITLEINGIINYVQILIECPKHGLWVKDFRL